MSAKTYHVRAADRTLVPVHLVRIETDLAISFAEPATESLRKRICERVGPNAFFNRLEVPGEKLTIVNCSEVESGFDAVTKELQHDSQVEFLRELYRPPGSDEMLMPTGTIMVAPVSSLRLTRKLRALDCDLVVAWGDVGIATLPKNACPFAICEDLLHGEFAGEVRFAEPNFSVFKQRKKLSGMSQEPAVDLNGIINALPLGEKEPCDVVVGVADDGVQLCHPAMRNRVEWGYDYVEQTSSLFKQPFAADFHGTVCAGLIAGLDGDTFRGVAAGCHIACYRVGRTIDDGFTNHSMNLQLALVRALRDGWRRGARVMNISLASDSLSSCLSEVIAEVSSGPPGGRDGGGMVVVVAAGNRSGDPLPPASHPDVIPAAGAMPNGTGWALASDPMFESAKNPNFPIMAPAWRLKVPTLKAIDRSQYFNYGGQTSVAAPIFAGAVARLLAKKPAAGVAEVRGALMAGAGATSGGSMKLLDVGAAEAAI